MSYLQLYEKNGLEYYGASDDLGDMSDRRLVYEDQSVTVLDAAENKMENVNPYRVMYRWVQLEI